VTWNFAVQQWTATIQYNGQSNQLGVFESEEEAACAFDAATRRLGGQGAAVNFSSPEVELAAVKIAVAERIQRNLRTLAEVNRNPAKSPVKNPILDLRASIGRHKSNGRSEYLPWEDELIMRAVAAAGSGNWHAKAESFPSIRTAWSLESRWRKLMRSGRTGGTADASRLSAEQKDSDPYSVKLQNTNKREQSTTLTQPPTKKMKTAEAANPGTQRQHPTWQRWEDQALAQVVGAQGSGNWQTKADAFPSDRTAVSLESRWRRLVRAGQAGLASNDHEHGNGTQLQADVPAFAKASLTGGKAK
jgi:hypothetical protein